MKIKNQKPDRACRGLISKLTIVSLVLILSFWLGHYSVEAMAKTAAANQAPGGVFVGVFREGAPANMAHIEKYTEQVGKKPAMVMWYLDWAQDFPAADIQKVFDYGAVPQIVWEPWYWSDNKKVKLEDIISGQWDKYIESWAKGVKSFNKPIFLRVAHEFNIDGYPWGVIHNNKDPQIYVKAFRHIVDIFKREKVQNVKWVWCFMNYSYPDEAWNDWAAAYPGDNYVDWVGLDGYNWGTTQDWSQWQQFKYLFRDQVRKAKQLWPTKPIMIAEFASAEKGGDKAAWIRELPGYLKSSMRDIDLIVWFDLLKETDWRIKSSPSSFAAYKEIMQDPLFSGSGDALALVTGKSPLAVEKKVAKARPAARAIKIDGNLSDWDVSAPLLMKDSSFFKEGTVWLGTKDLSGKVYLMWDATYLYVAAEVTDNFPLKNEKSGQNIWNGDALELVIGFDPKADPKRTFFGRKDYQIGLSTGNGAKNQAVIWSWQRRRSPEGGEIKVRKTKEPLGYVLEAKIPWQFFKGELAPQKGLRLGFDIALDDADKTGERERQFIWNGDYLFYKDPSVWGTLELD